MKKQDNESLIQELTKRLDWYIMKASDEEFDADEVQTLMKLLDNLKTEEDNVEDELPVEEALDDFWKHCEEREEEERLLLGTEEEKDKSEPVAEKEEDKPREGKLHKVLWYFRRRRFAVVAAAVLVVMVLGGSWQVVANAEKHGGFFWWMDKNEEGTTMITAPEGVDNESYNYKIEKYYGNKSSLTKAIDNLSFDVEKGEFVAIMGASGSGKTTLLNCISTIDKVTSGHIYVAGNDITKLRGNSLNKFRREELGFIFQDFNLLDTLTAYENIALALSIQNVNSREIDAKIKKVAKELDIVNVLNKYPYQMSGGEKQRIASARAIITNPSLILADEPTGALDSKSSRQLLDSIEFLNKKLNSTILMVTHDAFTASYASRVIFIKDGKIFSELNKENLSRKEFFDNIIDVVTLLGGEMNDAL